MLEVPDSRLDLARYSTRELVVGDEVRTVLGPELAILDGLAPACDTCQPRLEEKAHVLTCFVALGRLTTDQAIDRLNEQPCPHLEPEPLLIAEHAV